MDSVCTPQVLAMVICDRVIDDRITGKKSLIGLFDAIETTVLPCYIDELFVYISLTEGYANTDLQLRCIKTKNEEELFCMDRSVCFCDPLEVVDRCFAICYCEFPQAGEYRFQLYAGDSLLCERKFAVSLVDECELDEC